MRLTAINNIKEIENNKVSVFRKRGMLISSFELEFEDSFDSYEKDHCDCISISIIRDKTKLLITAVTNKNDIDEFITFSIGHKGVRKHHKIQFVR